MQMHTADRPIPFTPERVATELVFARRHLEAARQSLELVLQIVGELISERRPVASPRLERSRTRFAIQEDTPELG